MHHDLKLLLEFFEAKEAGLKPWEIRVKDRDFKVGDTVSFQEVNYFIQAGPFAIPTGRTLGPFKITYLLDASPMLVHGTCLFTHS